jgi:hypothetical protein
MKILGLWGFDVLDNRVTIASDTEANETATAA